MKVEIIDIQATDGVILNGLLHKNHSKKMIIATHGMGSDCFKERERIIAEEANLIGIDYLTYNNRGSYLMRNLFQEVDGKRERILQGTSFEDVEEGCFDMKGAIQKMVELGYQEIYLQGHSLGATKTLYTYTKMRKENDPLLQYVKGIILLSLIDIPRVLALYSNGKYQEYQQYAEEKEKEGKLLEFMPLNSFIKPISVKSYLKYTKYYQNFDFAKYHDAEFAFEELNAIQVPLFMRWGNVNEMIEQKAEDLVKLLNEKIKLKEKDINFIDGADHNYSGKERVLAKEIVQFFH